MQISVQTNPQDYLEQVSYQLSANELHQSFWWSSHEIFFTIATFFKMLKQNEGECGNRSNPMTFPNTQNKTFFSGKLTHTQVYYITFPTPDHFNSRQLRRLMNNELWSTVLTNLLQTSFSQLSSLYFSLCSFCISATFFFHWIMDSRILLIRAKNKHAQTQFSGDLRILGFCMMSNNELCGSFEIFIILQFSFQLSIYSKFMALWSQI